MHAEGASSCILKICGSLLQTPSLESNMADQLHSAIYITCGQACGDRNSSLCRTHVHSAAEIQVSAFSGCRSYACHPGRCPADRMVLRPPQAPPLNVSQCPAFATRPSAAVVRARPQDGGARCCEGLHAGAQDQEPGADKGHGEAALHRGRPSVRSHGPLPGARGGPEQGKRACLSLPPTTACLQQQPA